MLKYLQSFLFFITIISLAVYTAGCDGGGGGGGINRNNVGDNDPNTILFIGDSITGDVNYPGVPPYPAVVQSLEPELNIINSGRGNDTSANGAGRIGGELARYKPAVVFILYGAVDLIRGTRYQTVAANIRSMVNQAKANQTIPVVCTILPIPRTEPLLQASRDVNVFIREAARQEGAKILDLEKEFRGSEEQLLPDGLHPNGDGVFIMASAAAERL